MARFVPTQPDLFRAPEPEQPAATIDPLAELNALLRRLRGADCLPWPDAASTMAEERRALTLAHMAGPEGERVVKAIFEETERLFAANE